MELLATDRHRLSRYTVNLTEHHHPVVDFNLRASILKPLASLKELPATTAIHYNKHHDYMELRIGENMRIRIHHYNDATYPQTDKIIDGARNHRSWIQFDRSDMTRVLKDLKRHVSNKFKLAVIDLPEDAYSATVADSNIEVTYSADIDMKSNAGQPFIAGFNAEYMLDALDTVDGREVCLQFDDRNATMHPLYMTEQTTTATHDILILPCRLKQPETATASA
jgi:DNA polymerase III sliding clamp (beta) subunit (PCNA family)